MNYKLNTTRDISWYKVMLGVFGLIGVMTYDYVYADRGIFDEGLPNLTLEYLLRSLTIAFFVALLLMGLVVKRFSEFSLKFDRKYNLLNWGIAISLILSVLFTIIFVVNPKLFSQLTLEDGMVEWSSAIFLFAASGLTLISAVNFSRKYKGPRIINLILPFLAIMFFLIGMEEISWFQRVFEIDTPKMFDANYQREINLHNFATNPIENLYYLGAFTLLIVIPFLRPLINQLLKEIWLNQILPSHYSVLTGVFAYSYNFDMWDGVFTQASFFGSVLILCGWVLLKSSVKNRSSVLGILTMIVAQQIVFLINAENYERIWEITEFKEFFISFAFLIYAVDLFLRLKIVDNSSYN